MRNLDQETWKAGISNNENAVIIDVRTPFEIDQGYIPRALKINIQDAVGFMQQIDQLDKDKEYYVYCRAGSRSAQACMIMESKGFKNTYNLIGGFDKWNGPRTQ